MAPPICRCIFHGFLYCFYVLNNERRYFRRLLCDMLSVIQAFLYFIAGYHVLHTFMVYGWWWLPPAVIAWLKDLFRVLIVVVVVWTQRRRLVSYRQSMKTVWVLFFLLFLWSLLISLVQFSSIGSLFVGFKYDLYPLFVVLGATLLGYVYKGQTIVWYTRKLLTVILIWGLVWQCLKLFAPDLLSLVWYGPVGDYVLGSAPPLYYRTGPGGMMRLQGLFTGPNNYGFFLVGISWLLVLYFVRALSVTKKRLLIVLFVFSALWTLSRGAWIWIFCSRALAIVLFFPAWKKWLGVGAGLWLFGLVALSIWKGWSTIGHRTALVEGVQAFLYQPWWYGLGMAWPSVHYEGVYLPENQYMQILLDLWLPWLMLWLGIWFVLFRSVRVLYATDRESSLDVLIKKKQLLYLFSLGIIGLMIEGLFLHVWEDSMVNYLLLVPRGMLIGEFIGYERTASEPTGS